MAARKNKQTFEEKLQQLEDMVRQLETGGTTLEETLKSYEKGVELAEELKKELAQAEERLTVLRGGEEKAAESV